MSTGIDQKFLEFSQMFDENPSSNLQTLHEDGPILQELRDTLRTDKALDPNFAQDMAKRVKNAHSSLGQGIHWGDSLREALFSSMLSSKGLKAIALTVGLAGGAWYFGSWQVPNLIFIGLACLFLIGTAVWFESDWKSPKTDLASLQGLGFYSLPVLAVLLTGVLAEEAVKNLGTISATFSQPKNSLTLLGLAAGLGVSTLLFLALLPSWEATRDHYSQNRWRMLIHIGFYAAWSASIGIVLAALSFSTDPTLLDRSLLAGLTIIIFSALIICRVPYHPSGKQDLKAAMQRTRLSLLLSSLPIALTIVIFYQMNLTRELQKPIQYKKLISRVEKSHQTEMSIPKEQNGWVDLAPILMAQNNEVSKVGGLRELQEPYEKIKQNPQSTPWTEPSWKAKKKAFLKELPAIEAALGKPYFSDTPINAKNGFSLSNSAPNFITMRSIAQGLNVLTQEAVAQHHNQDAIHYTVLGLKWASKSKPNILIGLMVQIAIVNIALDPIEELIYQHQLSDAQLSELDRALKDSRLNVQSFTNVMSCEIYAVDKLLDQFKEKGATLVEQRNFTDSTLLTPRVAQFLPASYLKSERLAYLNFSLDKLERWSQLSAPSPEDRVQINPLNLATQIFAPNFGRAQQWFMYTISRTDALRILVALERYKLANKVYPNRLTALVPTYLDALPQDTMNEAMLGHKAGFQYKKVGDKFELISESKCYDDLDQPRGFYGPNALHKK